MSKRLGAWLSRIGGDHFGANFLIISFVVFIYLGPLVAVLFVRYSYGGSLSEIILIPWPGIVLTYFAGTIPATSTWMIFVFSLFVLYLPFSKSVVLGRILLVTAGPVLGLFASLCAYMLMTKSTAAINYIDCVFQASPRCAGINMYLIPGFVCGLVSPAVAQLCFRKGRAKKGES